MSLISRLFHHAIQLYQKKSHDEFKRSLANLESVQIEKLDSTLKYLATVRSIKAGIDSYEQFKEDYPVTSYADHAEFIQAQKKHGKSLWPELVRLQPTSGSTDAIKWIPYSAQLLKDFDAALGPWLYDFYKAHPQIFAGPHYWSLSWLPEDLRKEGLRLDDTELFPFWKQILLKKIMAVVEPVDKTASSEISMFATVVYLAYQKDLSFVSVWSPTYWLNLVSFLENHRESVALTLESGQWQAYQNDLKDLRCPKNAFQAKRLRQGLDVMELWPQLKTLSAWNTSTSQAFAEQIEKRWKGLKVVGKGLWATEACVTIPFQGQYVLAAKSHFFEFEDVSTGDVLPSWELQLGQIVSPIVTTTGGLIRYKMQDALKVTGFIEKTPCFEFLGRADGVDLVGEKTSSLRAHEVLQRLSCEKTESFLFAVKGTKNYYCALMDETAQPKKACELSEDLDRLLSESFHYRLARELGQLDKARVHLVKKPVRPYTQLHLNRGMVLGNIKLESLRLVSEQELQESIQCH